MPNSAGCCKEETKGLRSKESKTILDWLGTIILVILVWRFKIKSQNFLM